MIYRVHYLPTAETGDRLAVWIAAHGDELASLDRIRTVCMGTGCRAEVSTAKRRTVLGFIEPDGTAKCGTLMAAMRMEEK